MSRSLFLITVMALHSFALQAVKLIIPELKKNQLIPKQFTCDGQDTSPQISWDKVTGAKSYVLIMHDPDAPRPGGFTHWVIKNISPDVTSIPAGISASAKIGNTGVQVLNSSGKTGYKGPCPPPGEHRYVFKLYALDIDKVVGENKIEIAKNMEGHLVGKPATLMRKYRRKKLDKLPSTGIRVSV